ncbi:TonB-dependent receptor [Croceibacterium mercuriale]|uniref:TonB-dependent receptor n=1 Tax=Croceibacterium mercuriale TaxID=1572751 RepID=A0A0B2BSY8_9SPHN|nr:TonB-dependent receptor [Croceibacterium mercuriale]KHL24663.1 TonB-dependent receptor [Croceibacterium mercuriale]
MRKLTRPKLLASTLLVGAFATPAFAQVAPQTTDNVAGTPNTASAQVTAQDITAPSGNDIIVTGSLIRNPNLLAANPVTVVGSDEIDLQQSTLAEELLRELPGVVPSIGSAVNNGNGGASFVDLRGLGANRNLVLLDGVRLAPGTLSGQFDLNNIPLALVQRVDVLTGGASTTYGADAITGVVNFITRTDFAGVDLSVTGGIPEAGDGKSFRADLTVGANFADNRGNAVLSVGYQSVDPVFQGDREISVNQIDSFTGAIGGSGTSVPSRFSGVNPTGADSFTDGPNVQAGSRQIGPNGAFNAGSGFVPFNFNPDNIFQVPFERFNAYAAANYEVSDSVEFYNRALFSKNSVSTIIAPSGAFGTPVSVSLNNPFLTAAQRTAFCAFDTNPAVGYSARFSAAECAAAATATGPGDPNYRQVDNVSVFRRATEVGPRVSEYTTTYFDYRAGVRGSITDDLQYDVFGSYGESDNLQTITGYTLNSRVAQSLLVTRAADGTAACQSDANGCVPVNWFGPEGSITPDMVDFLTGISTSQTSATQFQARGTISGGAGFGSPWAAEQVSFAVGGEYRKYTAASLSDSLSSSGDLGGAGGANPNVSGGYDVWEALGEVIVPLVSDRPGFRTLQLEGGVRYSDYRVAAPTSPTYSTTTWKVGGRWEPVYGVTIRGIFNRAVRAPNIDELFRPINTLLTNLSDDPCASLDDSGVSLGLPTPTGVLRAVCIAQGAPAETIGAIAVPTSGQANYTGGGSLTLQPETSDSWSVGTILQPDFLPGFSASVDYYNIVVKDAISEPTPGDVIAACFISDLSVSNPACTAIRRNSIDGSLSGDPSISPGLPISFSNTGRFETDGIDLVLNYTRDFGVVGLSLGFNGNWTNKNSFNADVTSPVSSLRDCVGLYSENCGSVNGSIQPTFSWTQRTTLTYDALDVSLLWRHLSGVDYELQDERAAYTGPVPTVGGGDYNFNRIPAYDYFDLSLRYQHGEHLTYTLTVANLLDEEPPLVGNNIGSTSQNSGNTFPSTYDPVGRRFLLGARLRF